MLTILIADDHVIVRKGIRQIILEEFRFAEIVEVGDTATLIEKAFSGKWDLIISDFNMPGGGGLEALKSIRKKFPHQPFLLMSIYSAELYALRAMQAGASGFLRKDTAPDELINAVKIILSGRRYIYSPLAEKINKLPASALNILPHELLSKREMDVLVNLALGNSITGIAAKLNLSINTISTYRSRILEKTSLQNNAELIRYAIEKKLI